MLRKCALRRCALNRVKSPQQVPSRSRSCNLSSLPFFAAMKLKWEWILLRLFYIISCVSLLLMLCPFVSEAFDVIYAVNCGGQKHTDRYGVRYATDSHKVGISSDFGKSLSISRVHPEDMILYQTERYHTTSFSYDIPIEVEGEFILITKFAEVYFTHPNGKV